jgi:hypothetical protein
MTSFNLNYCFQGLSPNTVMSWVRVSTYERKGALFGPSQRNEAIKRNEVLAGTNASYL